MMCSRSISVRLVVGDFLRPIQFYRRLGQSAAFGHDHHALDHVFEFANVARPRPVLQHIHGFVRDGFHMLSHARRVLANKVLHQHRNVRASLAQWGQLDGKYIQPVKQIFSKSPVGNILLQIAVGGGEDPHIDMEGVNSA